MADNEGKAVRHPDRSRFSGEGRDLARIRSAPRVIPRAAGESAAHRDDAFGGNSSEQELRPHLNHSRTAATKPGIGLRDVRRLRNHPVVALQCRAAL